MKRGSDCIDSLIAFCLPEFVMNAEVIRLI